MNLEVLKKGSFKLEGSTKDEKVEDLIRKVFSPAEQDLIRKAEGYNSQLLIESEYEDSYVPSKKALPKGTQGNIFWNSLSEVVERWGDHPDDNDVASAVKVLWHTEDLMRLILENNFIHHVKLDIGYSLPLDRFFKAVSGFSSSCNSILKSMTEYAMVISDCGGGIKEKGYDDMVYFSIESFDDEDGEVDLMLTLCFYQLDTSILINSRDLCPEVLSSKVEELVQEWYNGTKDWESPMYSHCVYLSPTDVTEIFRDIIYSIPQLINDTVSAKPFSGCTISQISVMRRIISQMDYRGDYHPEGHCYLGVAPVWKVDDCWYYGDLLKNQIEVVYLLY